jgi:ataxin-3
MKEEKALGREKGKGGLTVELESCLSVLPIGWLFSLASHPAEVVQLPLRVVKVSSTLTQPVSKLMKASGSGVANPDEPTVDASSLPAQAGPSSPPARRNRRQEDLEPQSPDSEAFPTEPVRRPSRNAPQGNVDYDEEISSDDFEMDMDPTGQPTSRSARANQYDPIMNEAEQAGPSDFTFQSRSYDDEDQALQAALKASMEDLPADWKAPEPKPVRKSITSAADRMKAAQDKAQAALKRESDLRAEVEAEEKKRQKEAEEDDDEEKLEDLSPGKLTAPYHFAERS